MKKPEYKISNVDRMDPFLMSLTSSDNHWMFISSNGALTAGREKADYSLFPYITDNLIHSSLNTTGPTTTIEIYKDNNKLDTWSPLSYLPPRHNVEKNLYKDALGDNILFEEINKDLNITFRYQWLTSREYGFIKRTELVNDSDEEFNFKIIDGIQNILPSGLDVQTQQSLSNLSNAYKHSEIIKDTKLGIFSLGSLLMDRPDPGEALSANTVWVRSNINFKPSLSSPNNTNANVYAEVLTGAPGSYFINSQITLEQGQKAEWDIVLDVSQNHKSVVALNEKINFIKNEIDISIEQNQLSLIKYLGSADGFQVTSSKNNTLHHTSNVLFNIMRGGIFVHNYDINKPDFIKFLKIRNKTIYNSIVDKLDQLNEKATISELIDFGESQKSPSLARLCYEYLPITFGRRHGDPSRPWNKFNIKVNEGDSVIYYHEGNWRDIFQNWEGLIISYPKSLPSIISKFLNATTKDGYNPYRINKEGIDWEVVDENETWSHIGYWNDHQIIYLLKLLEAQWQIDRSFIFASLNKKIFSTANVPYRIKDDDKILENPKNTIDFDHALHQKIMNDVKRIGTDARLVLEQDQVVHVSMAEKLLVLQLSKLSNFIPDGGIWLNTQRPEWNDANNALVGYGVSMVTLYYLNRHISFINKVLLDVIMTEFEISVEVFDWFIDVKATFERYSPTINEKLDAVRRKTFVQELQKVFSNYREKTYNKSSSGKNKIKVIDIINFNNLVLAHFENSIKNNYKESLYGAYNTINIDGSNKMNVTSLYPMLEGQVSALSSEKVEPKNAIKMLNALFESDMYQKEQNSFMLYPRKDLKRFLEKNIIPEEIVNESNLFKTLIKRNNTDIIYKDSSGKYRFNDSLINSNYLKAKLDKLSNIEELRQIINNEENEILDHYIIVFDHQNYTGRSGTMYGYEGIGSIYWHMVSKLLLATQELYFKATQMDEDTDTLRGLGNLYYRIRSGLSSDKTPEQYGAFPYDPYSHTPYKRGAQQPGMTGQVKEEIITRMGELGCSINNEKLIFNPKLLKISEFLNENATFSYVDVNQKLCELDLSQNQLAFTYCQVPIIYELKDIEQNISILYTDNEIEIIRGDSLTKEISTEIFSRSGKIKEIKVCLRNSYFLF
tara:strand:- start:7118 stop:10480 length:3363 start_codon:yes stop_codon:yes gene_type:complete